MSVSVLCGGFGGARFTAPLAASAAPGDLTLVTNPGDDLRYLGLEVWPDFDSVLYAAAGIFDEELGWGIREDTTACADALGDAGWFRMGDRDIALSLRRTDWLDEGLDRAEVARRCCAAMGVATTIVPAAAQAHRTQVRTVEGWQPLQHHLVRRRAAHPPRDVAFAPRAAEATAEALAALEAGLVILGPSNPVTSLAPILTVPGILDGLLTAARVVAVSPVVRAVAPGRPPEQGRYRVRGQLMEMLGLPHSAAGVATLFDGAIDGLVVDHRDAADAGEVEARGLPVLRTDLLPETASGRARLAGEVVAFGRGLAPRTGRAVRSEVLSGLLGVSPPAAVPAG